MQILSENLGGIFIKTLKIFNRALIKGLLALTLVTSIFGNSFVIHSEDIITDTFESEGHVYEMEHILNNYNIFAFSDATGSHINGPVIAGGGVFRLAQNSLDITIPHWNKDKSSYGPIVSDFTRSVPNNNSYIKGDYATTGGYTQAKRLYVGVKNDNHIDTIANNPDLEIVKTDTYINWDKAYTNLVNESQTLLNQAVKTLTLDDVFYTQYQQGYIIVRENDNLLIPEEVFNAYSHLVYISDDKPFDLERITLNYDVSGVVKEKINVVTNDEEAALEGRLDLGALHHSLAYDGYHPNGPYVSGDEKSINIIHNYPNASTIINTQTQRFGQLFAPKATVYDNVGNINGNMIVHALYSPNSEPHFWPITGEPDIPQKQLYTIEGYKQDQDTNDNLANAEITLYDQDNHVLDTYLTKDDGYFIFKDLDQGIYTVSETKAPDGYKLDSKTKTITFDDHSETVINILFLNKKIDDEIPKSKQYEINGVKKDATTNETLAGAEISLFDDALNFISKTVTDETGSFEFKNLKAQTYIVKETKAPDGYDLGNNHKRIMFNEDSERSVSLIFFNEKFEDEIPKDSHYFISGYKQDQETQKPLSGAIISLFDQNQKLLETYETEEDGYFQFVVNQPGLYIVEETQAPLGYLLGNNRVEVNVSDENDNIMLLFENELLSQPEKPGGKEPKKPDQPDPETPEKPEVTDPKPTSPDEKVETDDVLIKNDIPKTPQTGISQSYLIILYTNTLLLSLALFLKLKKTS